MKLRYYYSESYFDAYDTKKYGSINGVKKNYKTVVKELSKYDINIAFRSAISQLKSNFAKEYLSKGANPNLKIDGHPGVFFFCGNAQWSVVNEFILAGVDLNCVDTESSYVTNIGDSLLGAVIHGQTDPNVRKKLILLLLEKGADVNLAYGKDKWTPMHVAASGGYHLIVKLLIEYGANKNPIDAESMTPLDWALRSRDANVNDQKFIGYIDKVIKIVERK